MLGEGKSWAQVIELVSPWPDSELRASDSGASNTKHAKLLAVAKRSLSSLLGHQLKHFACAASPLSTTFLCQRSCGFLHVIQMFVASLGSSSLWRVSWDGSEKQVWPTTAWKTEK